MTPRSFRLGIGLTDRVFAASLVTEMTESELNTLVALVQQSRYKKGTHGFISCRGEMENQTGVIVYSFSDVASAAAFHMRRQIEAKPPRLEILDRRPSEVREYLQ